MKKLCLFIATTLISGMICYAQNLIPNQNEKGKWGYIDDSGNIVLKHSYDDASAFSDGQAKVRKGNKWGYINPSGKEVIKIQFSEMRTWEGNYCKVAIGGKSTDGILNSGGKWGFINRNGEYILKCEYDEIGAFKDGIASVQKGGKYGYIDTQYKFIIPVKFAAVGSFNEDGVCWVNEGGKFLDKTNNKKIFGGKFGVYNKNGEIIVPVKYKSLGTWTLDPLVASPYISRILFTDEYAKAYNNVIKQSKKVKGYSLNDSISALQSRLIALKPANDNKVIAEAGTFNLKLWESINPEKFSSIKMGKDNAFAVSNNNKMGIIS